MGSRIACLGAAWRAACRCGASELVLAVALALAGAIGAVRAQGLSWESLGPATVSGAIRHLIVDPRDANRLYAAAENGGVWTLADVRDPLGQWQPLSDRLENLQMRGIAKSSIDAGFLVAANALGFVYKTTDHGVTWSRIGTRSFGYVRRLVMSDRLLAAPPGQVPAPPPVRESRIWLAAQSGLFLLLLRNGLLVAVQELYPGPVAPADRARDVLDVLVDPAQDEIFVAARDQGVWRALPSAGAGAQAWELVATSASFGDPASRMIKLARSADGQRVVAKFGRQVVASDSRGAPGAWRRLQAAGFGDDIGGSDIGYRGNYSGQRGEWAHAVAVSPSDPDHVVVGQAKLFISTSAGDGPSPSSAWAELDAGHEDQQSLVFSADGARLFVANDGGVFQLCRRASGDPPPRYVPCSRFGLNAGLVTAQFHRAALQGHQLVANADHQGLLGSVDIRIRPVPWRQATRNASGFGVHGLENDFVSADPAIAGRFYVQFNAEHLLRLRFPPTANEDLQPINPTDDLLRPFTLVTNDGSRFNQLNLGVGTVAADPRPSSRAMLVATHITLNQTYGVKLTRSRGVEPQGGPARSCDPRPPGGCFERPVTGTAAWTTVLGPVSEPLVSLVFSRRTDGVGFALDQGGAVFELRGLDGPTPRSGVATRAFDLADGRFARQLVEDPAAPGRLLAISDDQLLLSEDGRARHWVPLGVGRLPSGRLQALAVHPRKSSILFLGTESGLWISLDGGGSWTDAGIDLPRVRVMQVLTDDTHVYAVTFGRGIWAARLSGE